ncbi:MAG: hypothetical protein HC772_14915, partial [Leptolyngbyaceae cyanobacterium CRU_2_3]|nr:hypothetical protein [Leptolyngbyaceae cyanobacterium CRU_2_3]
GDAAMVSHGLIAAAMFFLCGVAYERTHTLEMDKMGGLAKQMPLAFALFTAVAMASLALPGMSGFVSELTIFLGFATDSAYSNSFRVIVVLLAAVGLVLTPMYLLSMLRRIFFGELKLKLEGGLNLDVSAREIFISLCLVIPVVGIGASAGGLAAFTQVLSHLPIDTGMAFVIVQHLSPDQESLLSLLLSRSTQMPVSEVQDGMALAPNQIYVIPPNASMTLTEGVLKLAPRDRTRGRFMSVDTFLLSLAEDRGNKAIAVVLSRGDGDGSRGLEAIKAAGGITFAQSQETAQADSMPNTAVATGQVDFILPPEKIAEKLVEISRHPYIAEQPAMPSTAIAASMADADVMALIFNLLRTATAVDFTHYKQTTLKRRIQRRMVLHQLERLEDYACYLQSTPTELTALYQDALILCH